MKLLADPQNRNKRNGPSAGILVLGCFLCTTFAVVTAYLHKNDRYQKYFLLASALILAVQGSFLAVDVQDFVFRYMLLNISVALGISALFHRGMAFLDDKSHGMQDASRRKAQGSIQRD